MSGSGASVSGNAHRAWYAAALADPARRIVIAFLEAQKVGMVRYDRKGETATVSIALNPQMRGKGLARPMLAGSEALVSAWAPIELVAFIRPENVASRKAFESAGYAAAGQADGEMLGFLRFIKPLR